MARRIGPKKKYQRRFGIIADERTSNKPTNKRKSEYGERLEEKQKVKFIYGLLEKKMLAYVRQAQKDRQNPAETLMRLLETRLDNVIFRLGLAATREQARQLVSHRHVLVNGKKLNIPSYQVGAGETIELKKAIYESRNIVAAREATKNNSKPTWIHIQDNQGKILNLPNEKEMPQDIKINYIFEYYSK